MMHNQNNQHQGSTHVKGPETPQPLTLTEAIIPVASLIVLVGLSYFLFGDAGAGGPNQVALTVATMIAVFIGWRRGHSLDSLREAAVASVGSGIGAIFILFAVGALIGTWAMSGTLLAMVYYGLQLLNPNYFFVTTVMICAVVSASIGSSWTVVGTIGIGLMGIAYNMGLNPAIAAAAVISGAYVRRHDVTTFRFRQPCRCRSGRGPLQAHARNAADHADRARASRCGVFFFLGGPGDFDASQPDRGHPAGIPHQPDTVRAADRGRRAWRCSSIRRSPPSSWERSREGYWHCSSRPNG